VQRRVARTVLRGPRRSNAPGLPGDDDFGPAFIKICAFFPYPTKIWINGHEWAKRQATHAGIGFTELSNGFAATDDPVGLQAICDRLGPTQITEFAERWFSVLPVPLTDADAAAGYWWELSMRQVEVSRTIVFTQPRHARGFFEALVADNLDIGRPDQIELIFSRHPVRRGRPPSVQRVFKTSVVTRGVEVTVNALYKHSRIKQYLKDGRALRVETVVNDSHDLGVQRRLHNLPELQTKARAANRRLLDTERVGQGCVLASPAFERIAHPTTTVDGRRAPALRFGDPRVQALAGALAVSLHAVTGITNKSLRALMTGLLGDSNYGMNRASYDLTRLRRNGLIVRIEGRNRYRLTDDGLAFAIFYTKVHNRVLRPLMAAPEPPTPPPIRAALRTIDQHVSARLADARLPSAAA
jgi:predicted transcriptional regulator